MWDLLYLLAIDESASVSSFNVFCSHDLSQVMRDNSMSCVYFVQYDILGCMERNV